MKRTIWLLILFLTACENKHDINKVKTGMHGAEVQTLMGTPDGKEIMPVNIEWWKYGANQLIVLHADTVTNVVPDVNNASEEMKKAFNAEDSSLKEVFDATKGITR